MNPDEQINLNASGVDPSDGTVYVKRTPLRMPLNLTEWFPADTIQKWTSEELEILLKDAKSAAGLHGSDQHRAGKVAGLLACAYALQIFSSRDIVMGASKLNAILKPLAPDPPPEVDELEHFRRLNRNFLHALLARVLERVVRTRFDHLNRIPPGLHRDIQLRAADRLDTARHMSTWDE